MVRPHHFHGPELFPAHEARDVRGRKVRDVVRHRRGAFNIVGNDGFAVRCGAVVAFGTPIVLLTRDEEQAERLRAQLGHATS